MGQRVGPYLLLEKLGEGGMGEVYRATDTTLKRAVAVKVLPQSVATDPGRLARFEREAEVLASLNHPNIAAIYGLERAAGSPALVMELVEGPTLAERIARGPLPPHEALTIGKQIAEALESAHEHGIVHRDLKPANVKVRDDGTVKVLDFGLAKSLAEPLGAVSSSRSATHLTAGTHAGIVLGTVGYMSPEQARGLQVDRRTDGFAFGAVLFEMLTGRPAFDGESTADILASVMGREPDYEKLPATLHPRVVELLRRCFEKAPRQRWQAIGDVRVEIEQVLADGTVRSVQQDSGLRGKTPHASPWLAGALVLTVAVASIVAWTLRPLVWPDRRLVARFVVAPSEGEVLDADGGLALSPDGAWMVYSSSRGGVRQLVLRSRRLGEPVVLRGTEGAVQPFWSPDGAWIGYLTDRELKRVPVSGGSAQTIGPVQGAFGAAWGPDDAIVFSSDGNLMQVPAAGGEPRVLVTPERRGFESLRWPSFLPGGRAVLFTISTTATKRVALASMTGAVTVLLNGTDAQYARSKHLLFADKGSLWAVPFDLSRLDLSGTPIPVVEGVQVNASGWALYDVADDGTLAYLNAGWDDSLRHLVWVDRQGVTELVPAEPRPFTYPRISPDGRRVALDVRDEANELWIWDFSLATLSRFTTNEGPDEYPVWTPDGTRIAYMSGGDIVWKDSMGTGEAEVLASKPGAGSTADPYFFTPSGEHLVFREQAAPDTLDNVGMIALTGGRETTWLLRGPSQERNAELSSNGRWLAYQSNESGRWEVYVRPFPNVGDGRWLISNLGGTRPLWSRDDTEIFYLEEGPNPRLMAVSVETEPLFVAGMRQPLMEWPYHALQPGRSYDVSPDGTRFLTSRAIPGKPSSGITIVLSWLDELNDQLRRN